MDDDPYCWPGTRCLRNLLDVRDLEELDKAEHEIVGVRTVELTTSVVPGAYDTAHLLRFHRLLFRDVYDWAGQIRLGNISKGNAPFCDVRLVGARLDQLFAELAGHRFLASLEREPFVASFGSLYGELNSIHPFREGNGRTQRAFLRQLAAHAGWSVRWESLERSANDGACREYLRSGRTATMIELLAPIVEPRAIWPDQRRDADQAHASTGSRRPAADPRSATHR
ncbi:Fic family protein [Pseudofrankia sp. DC12]|uniref:Fic/DOC family protein n=1 Tax=Pseudofrankia sp. DC12 TaxID=683315 RepID=UPI0005F7D71D|nr:Fic family protein [Pseudofrankia sp. DC12]